MLRSKLVHTTDASPNLQSPRSLPHGLCTIEACALNYGPLAFVLHPSPTLAMSEQVYHTRPLTSRGSIVWLASLLSLATSYLSIIGLQPQTPPSSLTSPSGSKDDPGSPLVFL